MLLIALLLGIVVAQQLFVIPGTTPIREALHNSMHTPWFFTVTFILCLLFLKLSVIRRIVVVAICALVLAGVTELLQTFTSDRLASVGDLQRNLVGAAFALVFGALVLPARLFPAPKSLWPSAGKIALAAVVLVATAIYSFWPVYQVYKHGQARTAMLPQLIDPLDPRLRSYVRTSKYSNLIVIGLEGNWPEYIGRDVIRVQFGDSEYPTFYIEDIGQPWHTYETLVLDLFVAGEEPLALVAAVQYQGDDGTSKYFEFSAQPGANRIAVPRKELVPDNASGIKVRDFLLYTTSEYAGRSMLVGAIYLR